MPKSYHFSELKRSESVQAKLAQEMPEGRLFRGRLFPSGRITIGLIPKKKIAIADDEYERTRQQVSYFKRSHYDYKEGLIHEHCIRIEKDSELGLSSISNCHKVKTRRHGLKGLPRSGRYRILEGTSVLEHKYGRRLGFYTLTCPYTEVELVYEFNRNFQEIMRRFFQEVKREFNRKNANFVYCAAYEVQPKRFEATGVVALHAHWVSPCYFDNTRNFVITADEIRDIYSRVCISVVGGVPNCSASLDSQVVKKSASAYLAKYLSKGGEMIEVIADVAPSQLPSRWWSCSASLRRAISKLTIELAQDICSLIMYGDSASPLLSSCLYYVKHIVIPSPLGDKTVGVAASARPEFLKTQRPYTWECMVDEEL